MQAVVSQDPRDTGKLGLLNPSLQRCNVPLCVEHTLDAVLAMAPFRVRGEQRSVPGVMSSELIEGDERVPKYVHEIFLTLEPITDRIFSGHWL
jgi:hypothetical protein